LIDPRYLLNVKVFGIAKIKILREAMKEGSPFAFDVRIIKVSKIIVSKIRVKSRTDNNVKMAKATALVKGDEVKVGKGPGFGTLFSKGRPTVLGYGVVEASECSACCVNNVFQFFLSISLVKG
jgi:hypothetical protein